MGERADFDIVIVGAGIAGASLGYRLAGQRRVALLERESQPGYHATGRSAAMFMENYGPPQVRALTRASRAFYVDPPRGFSDHLLLLPRGCLYVASHAQTALLQQARQQSHIDADGFAMLGRDETLALVPALRDDAVAGAIYERHAADIDVHELHNGFLSGMRRAGGRLLCDAELVAAARDGEGWQLTLADGRTLYARRLVNAAGAWADQIAEICGVPAIGLQPCRRTVFNFSAPPGMDFDDWPTVVGIDESFYFKPDAGQLLGSPANAEPVPPHDVMAEELDVATGIHHINAMTTLAVRRPKHVWAGLRSFVADGEMVIGEDNYCPAFFWLAAQGGYGIQSAAAVAELAAALLLDLPLPDRLAAAGIALQRLSPQRLR